MLPTVRASRPLSPELDADPFTRVVTGEVTADSGSPVATVYLFVQRDRYLPTEHSAIRTNPGVSRLWQQAFVYHCGQAGPYAPLILAAQLSPESGFSPFDPVFFCRFRQVYFHPVCPECGAKLELCRDDQLLVRSQLQSFSSSLDRYLVCRACAGSKRALIFYHSGAGASETTVTLSDHAGAADHSRSTSDPAVRVKGCSALIDDYRRLIGRGDPSGEHPCPKCARTYECYGPAREAAARLEPFSFYPFFALAFTRIPNKAESWPPLLNGLPALAGPSAPAEIPEAIAADKASLGGAESNDAAIYSILSRIQTSWRQRQGLGQIGDKELGAQDSEETLVLEERSMPASLRSAASEASVAAGDLDDTLILLRGEDRLGASQAEAETLELKTPAVEATGSSNRPEPISESLAPEEPVHFADTVTETIVIHTGEPPAEVTTVRRPAGAEQDDFAETVVLGNEPAESSPARKKPKPADELPETVILSHKTERDD